MLTSILQQYQTFKSVCGTYFFYSGLFWFSFIGSIIEFVSLIKPYGFYCRKRAIWMDVFTAIVFVNCAFLADACFIWYFVRIWKHLAKEKWVFFCHYIFTVQVAVLAVVLVDISSCTGSSSSGSWYFIL